MQLDRPLRLITPTLDGDILAVLARAEASFTPPQIRELIGDHSVEGVRKALRRLCEQGIVDVSRVGAAFAYKLNRSHLAAPLLAALTGFRELLHAQLRAEIDGWSIRAPYGAIFGSAAKGTMRPDSDIDLFIVRPARIEPDNKHWRSQLDTLSQHTSGWTGNDARVLEYASDEVRRGLTTGDRVLSDIRAEGILLTGSSTYLRRPPRAHA
jgi:predicted nucleotidyltransferase